MPRQFLRITMNNGSKWDIPCDIIADHRARYYTLEEIGDLTSKEARDYYNEEMEYALCHEDEIFDWAANNMNWDDVALWAVKVSDLEPDLEDGLCNGEKEIIVK